VLAGGETADISAGEHKSISAKKTCLVGPETMLFYCTMKDK